MQCFMGIKRHLWRLKGSMIDFEQVRFCLSVSREFRTESGRYDEIRLLWLNQAAVEIRFNPYHDPKNGRFTTGNKSGVDFSGESGIIEAGSDEMTISTIENPIEQKHTGKGNPNAIVHFNVALNNRQSKILEQLPEYDSRVIVPKKSVNMEDLSAMTAKTGDEFAMFTKDNERLVIRGNSYKVNINTEEAKALVAQGYKWSGHTHPGTDINVLMPSDGDKQILRCFEQEQSVIYNSKGSYQTFGKE